MRPAIRHVDASTPSKGRPWFSRPSTPRKLRIVGLTKMMYDITTNVVAPATVSRLSVVPFSANPKRRFRSAYIRPERFTENETAKLARRGEVAQLVEPPGRVRGIAGSIPALATAVDALLHAL